MINPSKIRLIPFFLLMVFSLQAQVKIKGKIISERDGAPLPGVTINISNQSGKLDNTTSNSSYDGSFSIKTKYSSGIIYLTFLGYQTEEIKFDSFSLSSIDLKTISLKEEIVKSIVVSSSSIDIVKDRKTPIASSTIFKNQLNNKIGNRDLVESFNDVSGIYTSRVGGGYSDSRISIRGFKQNDIAPMVDGIPLYDLETGLVDWSGLVSINDAVSSVQIQKGLGASKLVNSSIGGTFNMIFDDPSTLKGGLLSTKSGNDYYNKFLASYATGKFENGFSTAFTISQTKGDGYIDKTNFKSISYYLAFGLKKEKNNFQIKIFGSPQWHNQRKTAISLMEYLGSYDPKLFNKFEPKYNKDWGYLNGETNNTRTNYGHKPFGIFQWDLDISKTTQLSSKIYASIGSSGKTTLEGGIAGFGNYTSELGNYWNYDLYGLENNNDVALTLNYNNLYDENGQIAMNNIYNYNTGNYAFFTDVIPADFFYRKSYNGNYYNSSRNANPLYDRDANKDYFNANASGISLVSNVTDQKIYGGLMNFKTKIDNLTLNIGLDCRSTNYHKRKILSNLYGANAYWSNILVKDYYNAPNDQIQGMFMNDNQNLVYDQHNPYNEYFNIKSKGNSIDYDYNAKIKYAGTYGQVEYDLWRFNFLFQGGYNRQFIERIDNITNGTSTGTTNLEGYNYKGGFNFNITKKHNIWFNYGSISRPPVFVNVYTGLDNSKNKFFKNQKFSSFEAAYGFRSKYLIANLNAYISTDKGFEEPYYRQDYGNLGGIANIEKKHKGLEFEIESNLTSKLNLKGAFSIGDWKYSNNAVYRGYAEGNVFETQQLNIKNTFVGGAPQRTASFSGSYKLFSGFVLGGEFKYSDKLYSSSPLWQYSTRYGNRVAPLELPGFGLVNAFSGYNFYVHGGKQVIELRLNIDNLLNRVYMSESNSSILPSDSINSDPNNGTFTSNNYLFKGVPTVNSVLFGFGRTWNFNINYNF